MKKNKSALFFTCSLTEVYTSWVDGHISNYNADFYYQSREYNAECYKAREIL